MVAKIEYDTKYYRWRALSILWLEVPTVRPLHINLQMLRSVSPPLGLARRSPRFTYPKSAVGVSCWRYVVLHEVQQNA